MIQKRLIKIFNILFIMMCYWIIGLNFISTAEATPLVFLLFPSIVVIGFLIANKFIVGEKNINYIVTFYILQAVSVIVMFYLAQQLEVNISWDWGQVIQSAYNKVLNIPDQKYTYFATYPNNQFWLAFLTITFKIVKKLNPNAGFEVYKWTSMVLSIIFVQAAIAIIYQTARVLWNEKKAFFTGMISVLCAPLYLYAQFAYTDTSSLLIVALLVYYYIKYKQQEKCSRWYIAIYIGILAALAYKIKITSFILVIAIGIDFILGQNKLKEKFHGIAVVAVVMVCTVFALNTLTSSIVSFTEEEYEVYKMPPTHWVMMALNTTGGYNGDDVKYTLSFKTYDEKKVANISKIKTRVKEYGTVGYLDHTFMKKIKRTWTNCSMGGDDYVSRHPVDADNFSERLFSINGDLHWVYNFFASSYYILMMLLLGCSSLAALSKVWMKQNFLFAHIAIFGFTIFMLIWECNSRYLFIFIPLLILIASDGLFALWDWLNKRVLIKNKM